jgi:hypothetical protein
MAMKTDDKSFAWYRFRTELHMDREMTAAFGSDWQRAIDPAMEMLPEIYGTMPSDICAQNELRRLSNGRRFANVPIGSKILLVCREMIETV